MTIKQRLDADLKKALLARQKDTVTVLRGLKSAILYAEVAANQRQDGLSEAQIETVLAKEAKSRQESADVYAQAGDKQRADQELSEKKLIENYLPQQLADSELEAIINKVIAKLSVSSLAQMGQIIGQVKTEVGSTADGGRIAAFVKKALEAKIKT